MSETPNTKPTLHVRFTDSVLVSRREWIDGEPREIPEAEWNARVRIEALERRLASYARAVVRMCCITTKTQCETCECRKTCEPLRDSLGLGE